jgi:hypothetical protein
MARLSFPGGLAALALLLGCGSGTSSTGPSTPAPPSQPATPGTPATPAPPTYDVDARGIPRVATANYIDLSVISRISVFRSGIGHDYHDAFETCRSMKHYFQPRSTVDWSTITITSPVAGTISYLRTEQSAGTQVGIRSTEQPAFQFILFHVKPAAGVDSGVKVAAGQKLGTHIGTQTMSDIAVSVDTPTGFKLVSWFDVMTDDLFAAYQQRGISSRSSMVVTRAQRDAAPLACDGETFTRASTLEDWTTLK